MKFIIVFVTYFVCIKCNLLFNLKIEEKQNNQTEIPIEILKNYLHKYISREKVFLSISTRASNDYQKYLQRNLISDLLKLSYMETISYNILNTIHQFRRRNMNIFNVIFVDGNASLT